MNEVVIAGIGQTAVGEHWEISLRSLAVRAARAAMEDAGALQPQALYVGNFLASSVSNQANLGALIADHINLPHIEAFTCEASEASGAAALHLAYLAIKSGYVDTALVVGVEKVTDVIGQALETYIAESADYDYEGLQGQTPYGQAALLMRAYLEKYRAEHAAFASFPILAHHNSVNNPYAMFHKEVSVEGYQKAAVVNAPLNLLDVAPYADGAAAVLLTRKENIPDGFSQPLVAIVGSAMASDTLALHDRVDILEFAAATLSTQKALQAAGMALQEIHFFECWDATSIHALLSLEALGLFPRGSGWHRANVELFGLEGKLPLLTMGGNRARGYPLAAAGVYQAVEAVLQLRGQAGKNQVRDARFGMIQALAGPASSAVTHVLRCV